MKRHPLIRSRLAPLAAFLLVLIAAPPCHGLQIELLGGKLSVQADQVPLQTLLKRLAADHGISLRMDPAINPPVTVSFTNRNLEEGLKSLLRPHNHILIWRASPAYHKTASLPDYELAEIHVFRPGEKQRMVEIITEPEPEEPEEEDPEEPEAPPPVETNVIIKGNKVFVPVTLTYGDNAVETTLLFDTGAGSIVLHQNVAEELGIEGAQSSRGQGVGGLQITTQTTRLSSVKVGPHEKENLRTDIIEYRGEAEAEYNGLLGMNFIRGLKYTIDFDNQTIQWAP